VYFVTLKKAYNNTLQSNHTKSCNIICNNSFCNESYINIYALEGINDINLEWDHFGMTHSEIHLFCGIHFNHSCVLQYNNISHNFQCIDSNAICNDFRINNTNIQPNIETIIGLL